MGQKGLVLLFVALECSLAQANLSPEQAKSDWEAIQSNPTTQDVIQDNQNSFSFDHSHESPHMKSTHFQHFYKGVEVVGSMAIHQTILSPRHPGDAPGAENGRSYVVDRVARLDLSEKPQLPASSAMSIARSLLPHSEVVGTPSLKFLPEAEGSNARLVYWMDLQAGTSNEKREVVIDANSGQILVNVSKHLAIAPVDVVSAKDRGFEFAIIADKQNKPVGCAIQDIAGGKPVVMTEAECKNPPAGVMPKYPCEALSNGDPVQFDLRACSLEVLNSQVVGSDAAAVRAKENSELVLNYYADHFKRNSYDDHGSPLVSVIHAGEQWANAFWEVETSTMAYGDGDGKKTGDFTLGVDVAGHEMTHGVVASTAKLLMIGESGALNEATADFFGKMIANDGDWAMGKKVFLDPKAGGIRNLQDPAALTFCVAYDDKSGDCTERKPYPSTYAARQPNDPTCDKSNDNCWVHVNSTIHSHALYLMTEAIGKDKAETIYYATLTHSLTARDGLNSGAKAVKSMCPKLYDSSTCEQVNHAFAQVGE